MNLKYIEQLTEYFDINQEKIVEKENEYLENMDLHKDIWESTKRSIDNLKDVTYKDIDSDVDIKYLDKCIYQEEGNNELISTKYELMKEDVERIYDDEEMEVCLFISKRGNEYLHNEETNYLYDRETSALVGKMDTDTNLITYKLFSKVRGC